jgi:hypothetical protein
LPSDEALEAATVSAELLANASSECRAMAHRERRVENPSPVFVAQGSHKEEEEHEVNPGPHPAHPFEVAEETVRARRRKKRRERRGSQERDEGPEDGLIVKVERIPAKAERQYECGNSDFDDDAEEDIPRHHVRKKEI